MSPLPVLYQDRWIVAVDKPAGQIVHPAENPQPDDAVTMKILRDQIGKNVHTLHRLDRPTCGVLLFATEDGIARALRTAFDSHQIEKTYWAVTDGVPETPTWTCREPIQKKPGSPLRPAETAFRILQSLSHGLALVEAKPRSGRYHQIRRHLLHGGTPIVGDYRYSGIRRSDELGTRLGTGCRMLLQARRIGFTHPVTGLPTLIEAPPDPLIVRLVSQTTHKSKLARQPSRA